VALRDLKGLRVEIDYLTVAGSDVLRMIYRLQQRRGAEQALWAGATVAARLGGDPLRLTCVANTLRGGDPVGYVDSGSAGAL
jgi:hypothetical protein